MSKAYEVLGLYINMIVVLTVITVISVFVIPNSWIIHTTVAGTALIIMVAGGMFYKIFQYSEIKEEQPNHNFIDSYDYEREYLRLRDLLEINVPGFTLRTDKNAWSLNDRTLVYRLKMADDVNPSAMRKGLPTIRTHLYSWRKGAKVPVDKTFNIVFDDMPPCLVVPRVKPKTMSYEKHDVKLKPLHLLVGKDYSGDKPELITIDLESPDGFTTLMGGSSGSGKTTLLRALLCSLMENTSPRKLKLHIIDIEGKGMGRFRDMPHTASYITTIDGARKFLKHVRSELTGPDNIYNEINFIVCDELMTLTEHKDITQDLLQLCARMRAYGWSALFISQVTQNGSVPTSIRDNMQCRIAGRCKREAQSEGFLGKGNVQAVQLPRGSFIVQYDDFEGIVNTYFLDYNTFKTEMDRIYSNWENVSHQLTDYDQQVFDSNEQIIDSIPPAIRQLITTWYDNDTNGLKRNGKATIMRHMLELKAKEKLPTGTTYTTLSKEIDGYVQDYKNTLM